MSSKNNNIEILIFTNEHYFDILHVTLPRISKYLQSLNSNINLVINKYKSDYRFNDINVIETNVEFKRDGSHFRDSLLFALSKIESEYIFFFCDDYMVESELKIDNFNKLMEIIKFYNVDYYSFSSLNYCDHVVKDWRVVNSNLSEFGFDGGVLYEIPNNFVHLYSVQPCIWKTESLKTLLHHNKNLSLHDLDNTRIKNKKGNYIKLSENPSYYIEDVDTNFDYNFTNFTINYPPLTYNIDDRPIGSDYLILNYGEILRYGKVIESMTNSKRILFDFLDKNPNIKNIVEKFL